MTRLFGGVKNVFCDEVNFLEFEEKLQVKIVYKNREDIEGLSELYENALKEVTYIVPNVYFRKQKEGFSLTWCYEFDGNSTKYPNLMRDVQKDIDTICDYEFIKIYFDAYKSEIENKEN